MMKFLRFAIIIALFVDCGNVFSQSLTCLTPTLVFSDPTLPGNPTITSPINCNYAGLIMVRTSPGLNNPTTAGNAPCLRFQTSLTNTNSTTNNSLALFQGTTASGAVCGTCALSIPNNSLYTLYWYGLVPSLSHSYAMCNVNVAPNMTYSVYSCFSDVLLSNGIWNNGVANSCATITIPANTAIGTASYAISPTVVPGAIVQNSGNGSIIYDPYQMAAGIYTVTYTFNSQNVCTSTASRTFQINNPYLGAGSAWTAPPPLCPNGACISLTPQINIGAYLGGTFTGPGVGTNSFCPSITGPGSFVVTYSVGVTAVCSATNTNTIVVAPQPTANAGPTKSITCISNPTVLSGSGGGTYSWSNSVLGNNFSAAQNPTVSLSPSTYTLIVSNGTCFSTPSTVQVVTNTTPPSLPTTTVSNVLNCINTTATINTTGAGITYAWTGPGIVSGSNTANPVVNLPGTYNFTVTSTSNGCTNSSNTAVTQNTAVSVSLSTVGVITCVSNTASISGNQPTYSYTWTAPGGGAITSGQSTPTINVLGNGIYSVTVMNPANGCTTVAAISTSISTVQAAPNASATGTVNCISNSITLSSSTGGVTYTWVPPGGASVVSPNSATTGANGSGIYTLNVTNTTNGCTNTRTVSPVTQTTAPVANIANNPTVSCLTPTVVINGGPASGVTYSWTTSGGSIVGSNTVQNVSVNAGGIYSLAVTSVSNGCTSVSAATVNISSNFTTPTLSAISQTGALICASPSTALSGTANPAGSTYTWTSNGGSFMGGINGQTVAVSTATLYYLNATHPVSGCTTSLTYTVIPDVNSPTVTLSSPSGTITCVTSALSTTATSNPPSGISYSWTGPGIVGTNTSAAVTGTAVGIYSLIVTNTVNNCASNVSYIITSNNATINPNATVTNTIGCITTSATINTAATPTTGSYSYTWTGPGVGGFTTSSVPVSPTVNTVYTVTLLNPVNSCSATQVVTVVANVTAPGLTMGSNVLLPCNPATVQITSTVSPATSTVQWMGPNVVSGGTSTNAVAGAAGVYTLTATTPSNGCTTISTLTVSPSSSLNVTISNTGTITCNPTTVQVIASATPATNSYSWSGPGIVAGAGTPSITVNLAGNYSVLVTNTVNGCTFNITNSVTANNSTIAPNAVVSNSVNCITPTANISTAATPTIGGAYSYSWTGPGVGGFTTSAVAVTPTVNTVYTVTVLNPVNSCSATQIVTVVANVISPAVTMGPNVLLPCNPSTVLITSTVTPGTATVQWSGPNVIAGGNFSTAVVGAPGVYTLTATTPSNGCTTISTLTVTPNSAAPTYSVNNISPSITCSSAASVSVTITSTVPVTSIAWSSTVGISGATDTPTPTFTLAGTYTAVITANNGCTTTFTLVVGSATTAPSITAGTIQNISCSNATVTIAPIFNPPADLTFTWTGVGIISPTNNISIQVNQSGNYTVTVTNSVTGCSTVMTIPVSGNTIVPSLSVSASSTLGISCLPGSNTVTLTASSGTLVNYSWNTGATSAAITATAPGVYTVTVTDPTSNCTNTGTVSVNSNITAPTLTTSASGNLPCNASGTIALTASSSNTNVTYNWTGPAAGIISGSNSANPIIGLPGIYTVTVLNALNGCSTTNTISISQTTVNAVAAANVTIGPAPLTVNFDNLSNGAITYSWALGDGNTTSQNIPAPNTYTNPGTYTVILYAYNGSCLHSDTLIIKVQEGLGVIPEIFTPNGDGKNEIFVINGLDSYPKNSFNVFNRWGNPVYIAEPYKNDWDGSPNVSGKTGSGKLPSGTYYYILKLGDEDNRIYRGFIQIQY